MKIDEIIEFIKGLAKSQGFYGRLYEYIMAIKEYDKEEYDKLVTDLESQNFKEPLDIVYYFEQ